MRHRVLAALAVLAVAAGLSLAGTAAYASSVRQTFGELFLGSPSVTVPECESTGTALLDAGRFDFFRCVTADVGSTQAEELEGFVITN